MGFLKQGFSGALAAGMGFDIRRALRGAECDDSRRDKGKDV